MPGAALPPSAASDVYKRQAAVVSVDDIFESPIDACGEDADAACCDESTDMDFWMVHGMLEKHAVSAIERRQHQHQHQQKTQHHQEELDNLFDDADFNDDADVMDFNPPACGFGATARGSSVVCNLDSIFASIATVH